MATRCYFNGHVNDASDINLSGSLIGNWDQDTSFLPSRTISLDEKLTGYSGTFTCTKTGSVAVRAIGQQFITNPLDAVTLNFATLKAQFLCREAESDNNAYLSIAVGYCDSDGSSPTLLFHIDDGTEMDTDAVVSENRQWTAADQTNYSLTQGQRLIVEIGAFHNNTKNETDNAYIVVLNSNATDLPEDNTSTNLYNSWFETGDTFTEASGEPATMKLGPMFAFA